MTGYSSVFTRTTPTRNYLTAAFKCFLITTSRSRENCGKNCCYSMKKSKNRKNRQKTLTGFIGKGKKYFNLDELTSAVLNDRVKAV